MNHRSDSRVRRAERSLETGLLVFLGAVAAAVPVVAIMMMLDMEAGSRGQGGRFYVAVFALFVLGAVLMQVEKVLHRRSRTITPSPLERRFALWSLLILIAVGGLLIGLALRFP